MNNAPSIPLYNENSVASPETMNAPLTVIQGALDNLFGAIAGLNNKSAIITFGVVVASDVVVGDLVYFDDTDQRYKKALAQQSPVNGAHGESLNMPSCYVQGMVIRKNSAESADVLAGGFYEDAAAIQSCLGAGAEPGTYYLSSTAPGKAVLKGTLRQPVLTYLGDSKFSLSLFYQSQDSHYHRSYTLLPSKWLSIANFDSTWDAPSTATFGYNISDDPELEALGTLDADVMEVFYQGALQKDDFIITAKNIWYTKTPAPSSNTYLYTHLPVSGNSPVLRGILSHSSRLAVEAVNGIAMLQLKNYISNVPALSRYALSGLTESTALITPVISTITQGPGMYVDIDQYGNALISTEGNMNTPLDAESLNLNGVSQVTDGIYTVLQFPKGNTSSITISRSVPGLSASTSLGVTVWCMPVMGSTTFDVNLYFVPDAIAGAPVDLTASNTPIYKTTLTVAAGATMTEATFAETARGASAVISGSGTLIATIKATSPASDVRLLKTGFTLYREEPGSITPDTPVIGDTNAIIQTGYAAETMAKYTVVRMSNGSLFPVKNTDLSAIDQSLGVTLAQVTAGSAVSYMISGVIQDDALGLVPSKALYVGSTGNLTSEVPTGNSFIQEIGQSLTAAALLVRVQKGYLPESE